MSIIWHYSVAGDISSEFRRPRRVKIAGARRFAYILPAAWAKLQVYDHLICKDTKSAGPDEQMGAVWAEAKEYHV